MEELRQREANLTALNAIGPRKKPKLEPGSSPSLQVEYYYFIYLNNYERVINDNFNVTKFNYN